jgi:uncharacterized membrane protein YtjA (UPF0391 family)
MLRWWGLSVVVAVVTVLFGFGGIHGGGRVLAGIAFTASLALLVAFAADAVARRVAIRP